MPRNTAPAPEQHLTITQLAARLQVPVETIYGWNHSGKRPAYIKAGRHVRYRLSAVEAWEKSREVNRADRWT